MEARPSETAGNGATLGGARAAGPVPVRYGTGASLLLLVVIWGVNFAVVKRALEAFDPLAFNALRFLLASVFVWAVMRRRGTIRLPAREDWPRLLLLGLGGNVLYQIAFILGLDRTRAGNASLLLALVPVFVLLFTLRDDGEERHGAATWIGAALSVLGVGLVSRSSMRLEGMETLIGDLILLGAAVAWAAYTVGARPMIRRYGSLQTTAWTLWVGAAGLALVGAPGLLGQTWSGIGWAGWAGLLYSAILSIGLAYLIWYRGVERIGSARTALFGNLTPVVALFTGAVWLDERLTLLALTGAALTIAGVGMVRR